MIEALIKDISPVFIYNTFHHPLIAININAIAAFSLASSATIGVSVSSSSSSPRIMLFSSSFATTFATSAFEEFARSIAASTMQHVLVLELLAVVVCIIIVV